VQIFGNKNILFIKPFVEKGLQTPIIRTFEINNSTLQALLAGSYALRAGSERRRVMRVNSQGVNSLRSWTLHS
jgi:hypothetical protein